MMNSLNYCVLTTYFVAIFTVHGEFLEHHENLDVECGREIGITWEDIVEYRNNATNPSEKMLCFLKCKFEKNGKIDSFGVINMKVLNPRIHRLKMYSKTERKELSQCIRHIGAIKSCGDMERIIDCASDIMGLVYEITPRFKEHQIQCAMETGLPWTELIQFDRRNPSDKLMCYVKCFLEKEGKLTEEGNLNLEILYRQIDNSKRSNYIERTEIKECLKNVSTVKDCGDTRAIINCARVNWITTHFKHHDECVTELAESQSGSYQKNAIKDHRILTEDNLCYSKCMYHKNGRIDENGELNLEIINDSINKIRYFKSERKEEIKKCMAELPPIKNCEYMKYVRQCFSQRKIR